MANIPLNYLAKGQQKISQPITLEARSGLLSNERAFLNSGHRISMPNVGQFAQVPFLAKGTDIGKIVGERVQDFGHVVIEHALKKADLDARITAKEAATEKQAELYEYLYGDIYSSPMFKTGKDFIDIYSTARKEVESILAGGAEGLSEAAQQYYVSEISTLSQRAQEKLARRAIEENKTRAADVLTFEYENRKAAAVPLFGDGTAFVTEVFDIAQWRSSTFGEPIPMAMSTAFTEVVTGILTGTPISDISLDPEALGSNDDIRSILMANDPLNLLSKEFVMKDGTILTYGQFIAGLPQDAQIKINAAIDARLDKIDAALKRHTSIVGNIQAYAEQKSFTELIPTLTDLVKQGQMGKVKQLMAEQSAIYGISASNNIQQYVNMISTEEETTLEGHIALARARNQNLHPRYWSDFIALEARRDPRVVVKGSDAGAQAKDYLLNLDSDLEKDIKHLRERWEAIFSEGYSLLGSIQKPETRTALLIAEKRVRDELSAILHDPTAKVDYKQRLAEIEQEILFDPNSTFWSEIESTLEVQYANNGGTLIPVLKDIDTDQYYEWVSTLNPNQIDQLVDQEIYKIDSSLPLLVRHEKRQQILDQAAYLKAKLFRIQTSSEPEPESESTSKPEGDNKSWSEDVMEFLKFKEFQEALKTHRQLQSPQQ